MTRAIATLSCELLLITTHQLHIIASLPTLQYFSVIASVTTRLRCDRIFNYYKFTAELHVLNAVVSMI